MGGTLRGETFFFLLEKRGRMQSKEIKKNQLCELQKMYYISVFQKITVVYLLLVLLVEYLIYPTKYTQIFDFKMYDMNYQPSYIYNHNYQYRCKTNYDFQLGTQ